MKISIKKGSVSKNTSDKTFRPIQSVEYLGRDGDVEIFFPYGFHANVPEGAMAVLFSMLGQSSNKIAMLSSPEKRIKVQSGEVVVFNPETKAKTYFKKDGSIVTNTDKATLTILKDGKVEIKNAGGSVTINSDGTVTIDSSQVTMTGNLQIDGSLNVDGTISADGAISSAVSVSAPQISGTNVSASSSMEVSGTEMKNHKHSSGTYAAGGDNVTGNSGNPN